MPEMHLRQPQFVYSACAPFTRHKKSRVQNLGFVQFFVLFYQKYMSPARF